MNTDVEDVSIVSSEKGDMPALGFGTWQLEGEECINAIPIAVETGYRHIDTAQVYGNEAEVGKGLEASGIDQQDIFLTTKIWMDNLSPSDVKQSTQESLNKLRTDYVDLLLIHWPSDSVPLDETLGAMSDLVDAGSVKHLGVSNFTTRHLDEAKEVSDKPIFCNQVEYHPYLDQTPVLNWCRENDTFLVAYSPLARADVFSDETLQKIGAQYGKTAGQVCLRWHLQQPGVSAIPKSANPNHIRANFDIFDFQLSDEDMDRINQMRGDGRLIEPAWAPDWD